MQSSFRANKKACEANPVGENSSFVFKICVESVPLHHFKFAYADLNVAVKDFSETHF